MIDCGGCRGIGSHRKWCAQEVGQIAALYGRLSQQAENLADAVGANDPVVANMLYEASQRLNIRARTEYSIHKHIREIRP